MLIDWNGFTPIASAIGGGLVGVATAILLLFNGRIAGISGIVGGLLRWEPKETGWRLSFIAGLMFAPVLYRAIGRLPLLAIDAGSTRLVAAGLLVGIGTRFASGCTSGHGVCGLSRGSLRSLTATLCFMLAGFITVWVVRHILGT